MNCALSSMECYLSYCIYVNLHMYFYNSNYENELQFQYAIYNYVLALYVSLQQLTNIYVEFVINYFIVPETTTDHLW